MITRKQIVKEALTWEGTPFHDQQCVKGLGVDCAMLAFGIAANLGTVDKNDRLKIAKYSPEFHFHNNESALIEAMELFGCKEVPYNKMKIGDIVVFEYGKTISHLGILIDKIEDTHVIIHAVKGTIKKVVISNMLDDLQNRFRKAYKFPGVK